MRINEFFYELTRCVVFSERCSNQFHSLEVLRVVVGLIQRMLHRGVLGTGGGIRFHSCGINVALRPGYQCTALLRNPLEVSFERPELDSR